MEVILIERVAKLGQIGDVVRVRDGFARNFLLPHGKALRATKQNKEKFESMKADLEAKNTTKKSSAGEAGKKLDGQSFVLVRQAGETGQLYGSVSTRDIADVIAKSGHVVDRQQVVLNMPIKVIGLHVIPVELHPEVEVKVTINVARSEDEAKRQARGEDLTVARSDEDEAKAEARLKADKFFEKAPEGEEAEAGDKAEKPAREKKAKKSKDGEADEQADAKPKTAKTRGQKEAGAATEQADAKPAKKEKKEKSSKKQF
jgi:large subunit ribosomal protein L9